MNDETSLNNSGNDTNTPKKSNTLIIGIIGLVVIIGVGVGYYFTMVKPINTNSGNIIKKEQETDVKEALVNETVKSDDVTIDPDITIEVDNTTKQGDTTNTIDSKIGTDTVDTNKTDIDTNSDTSLNNILSDIDNKGLDEEEQKLASLLTEFKNEDKTTSGDVVNTKVVEKYKIPVLANGKLDIPEEYIKVNNDKIEITEKGLTDFGIEKNSVVYDLVLDNINTGTNNYANSSFKFKIYELTIDKDYKIISVKKNSIIDENSKLLGLTIFEIQNFYKSKN